MKSLFIKIKNLIPYLLLVTIYFIFVNIEAKNDQSGYKKNTKIILNVEENDLMKSNINENSQRIAIPVIPFNQ